MLELDPTGLTEQQREQLLLWSVTPRPIAMVSTTSANGEPNLAPFSYFTAVGYDPMALVYCVGRRRDGSEKDSCRNARPPIEGGTGEFTVNVLVEEHAHAAGTAAAPLPHGESEYVLAGLRPVPGTVVGCPRIAGSPIAYECRTVAVVEVGNHMAVIGEVAHIVVAEDLLDPHTFRVDPDLLGAVGRVGTADYLRTTDRFEVRGPGAGRAQMTTAAGSSRTAISRSSSRSGSATSS